MKAFEIYSGVGGMGIGFEAAGIQVSGGVDAWDRVSHVRRANEMPYSVWDASDISKLAAEIARYKMDAIIGGPPCQDFSKAGKRQSGANAALTRSFALLTAAAGTEWFVFENVPDAAKAQEYFDAREIWMKSGYGLTELFLDASLYGVPQARKRLIVVGRRGERYQFMQEPLEQAASKEQRTVRSVLDPRDPDDARLLEIGYYYSRGWTSGGAGVRSIDDPAPGINSTFREPPYGKHKVIDNPKDAIHATKAHVLTQQQMARFQGFPRSFRWVPTGAQIVVKDVDQMIANAVPPAFAYHIAKTIRERQEEKSFTKVNRVLGTHLQLTTDLTDRSIDNICSRVNRARKLLEGRTYPAVDVEVAMLDRVFNRMQEAWDRNQKLPVGSREVVPTPFDVHQKSDMRAALRLYAEMPRPKSDVQKVIEKSEAERKSERKKKPPLFPRAKLQWKPKWTISDLLHSPVPTYGSKRILTPPISNRTAEQANLAHKPDQDSDTYPDDDYRLSPPDVDDGRPQD